MQNYLPTIYALPAGAQDRQIQFGGREVEGLVADMSAFQRLPDSFEELAGRLTSRLEVPVEPDGSFAWTGTENGQRFEIVGLIFDGGESAAYIEIFGRAVERRWRQFLDALIDHHSAERYMVFLRNHGICFTTEQFLKLVELEQLNR